MSHLAFFLIALSAVAQASYMVLVKHSEDRDRFLGSIYARSTAIIALVTFLVVPSQQVVLSAVGYGIAVLAAFLFCIYLTLSSRAYSESGGDLSLVYPLTTSSPLYAPFLGYLILDERISAIAVCGVLLVVFGVWTLHRSHIANLAGSRAVWLALAAGLVYAFGVLCDRAGVLRENPIAFSLTMMVFMSFGFLIYGFSRGRAVNPRTFFRSRDWLASLFLSISVLSFRIGLVSTSVAAATAVRQTSVLFGVLFGAVFLKEAHGTVRAFGAVLIILGAILVKLG